MGKPPKASSGKILGPSDLDEEVLGQLQVVAELALGLEKLSIIVTNRRLIIAHLRKKGAGAMASVSFLGKYALDKLEKEKAGSRVTQKPEAISVAEVLRADKDNFQINHEDVVMLEIRKSPSTVKILLLTGDDKYQFTTGEDFRRVESLLRMVLGTKLSVTSLR